jgi:lambda family phage portal protein
VTLLDRIAGLFGRAKPAAPTRVATMNHLLEAAQQIARAWNAADDDRLTKNHWGNTQSVAINQDLVSDLVTMRQRTRWERQNNGILEGMVTSNAMDVVGPRGPTLQVSTTDSAFRERAEQLWREWWAMPDLNGQLSGVDMLVQDIRSEWDNGESLKQRVNDPTARGIQLRLLAIAPRRLESPMGTAVSGLGNITLGVTRSATGKPLSYWIREDSDSEFNPSLGMRYVEVPARNLIHDFEIQETGQARGIPLLASCLQVVAQLRDWDKDVQQAMRMAAMLAVFFTTTDKEARPITLDGGIDLESGQATALPPGYDAKQMQPAQPGQKYNDFRDAKLGEIGRPRGMPLMMVKLDSAGHSYSSARFDGQTYQRTVEARQARMERVTMSPLFADVMREAQLLGLIGRTPADLRIGWVWPRRPHVDPGKESDAIHQRLEDGTIDQAAACAEYGMDADVVRERRVAQGMSAGPTWVGADAVPQRPRVVAGNQSNQDGDA